MTYYLGIYGGLGTTNASAALLKDKQIIAFAEEERFTRIKTAPSALPVNAIFYCLKEANIKIKSVKSISFAWDCSHQYKNVPHIKNKIYSKYKNLRNSYNLNLDKTFTLGLDPNKIYNDLKWAFAKKNQILNKKKLIFYKHHLCHAASTFYASGFSSASIVVFDGMGEEFTGGLYKGYGNKIECIKKFKLPNTLGGYYSTFTDFLGFKINSEEGKFMALAAYGKFSKKTQKLLDKFLKYEKNTGEFTLLPSLRFSGNRSFSQRFSDRFVKIFGKPRLADEKITTKHKNLAFNVQWRLEEIVKLISKKIIQKTGYPNLCLAGGVHMNCKLNGFISNLPQVKKIYIQPASSDNGVSLGAAMISANNRSGLFQRMSHCYYGSGFSNSEILKAIKEAKLDFIKHKNINKEVSKKLAKGKIVGWFQGRAEVGARALGNRSILANPLIEKIKFKLNKEVKHRELWRPFCPSVIDKKYKEYFGNVSESEFMILAFKVKKKYKNIIHSAIHVDGTARPQIVKKNINSKFYDLLQRFGKITGHPVLINTSFNIQGEPIVNTPSEAIRCFSGTGIDLLAIGDYLIKK